MNIGTNTHYVTRPGYEGPCCADCAAAVGGYRALEESHVEFGEPCWPCQESERPLCGSCDGSGEGYVDGSRCLACRGKGYEPERSAA